MLFKDPRVFIVHSRSRAIQTRLYDLLCSRLTPLDIKVTRYQEWLWETPGGISERDYDARLYKHRQGWRELNGLGWIQDAPIEARLLAKRERAPEVNGPDLTELITESGCVVLIEEEGQEQLSAGIQAELAVLEHIEKRSLNVRVCNNLDHVYEHSIYPFTDQWDSNGVLPIRIENDDSFVGADLDLITFILAMWCDDTAGAKDIQHTNGQRRHDPNFAICPVGLRPRDRLRFEMSCRLAQSADDYARRAALLYMAAARHIRLRAELCRFLGRLFKELSVSSKYIEDYIRFMELTPDIEWVEVIEAINANKERSISQSK